MSSKYSHLYKENVLRISPYVPGKPIEEVKRELGLREVHKLASNENMLGPSPKAVEAVKAHAAEINYYPESSSYYLRHKLAKKLGVKPEQIMVTDGSVELINMLAIGFLGSGDEVVLGNPAFAMYPIAAQMADATIKFVSLDENLNYDVKGMLEAVGPKTKMVVFCNPNNPTGTYVKADEFKWFMERVDERVLVVVDEAYYEFVDAPDYPEHLDYFKEGRRMVILRTFSKAYGLAGLRVGYGIMDEEVAEYLLKVYPPFNVTSLAQVAAMAALDDEEHLRKSRELVKKGKEFLYREFDRMGLKYYPSQTNFVLVRINKDAEEVFFELQKKGIIVRPLGRKFPDMLRITVGTKEQNEKLIAALEEVLS